MEQNDLWRFVEESNRIEGIKMSMVGTEQHVKTTLKFLNLKQWGVEDLQEYVYNIQPPDMFKPQLRNQPQVPNVRVGAHIAPDSGPEIFYALVNIINMSNNNLDHPHKVHHMYETLHPFTDGNGRSGRVIWAWQMNKFYATEDPGWLRRGFLHTWYYQSLHFSDTRHDDIQSDSE